MIRSYTQHLHAETWLTRYQNQKPTVACVLGFTETGLLPGISAAGATPESRRYTAIADAEFLVNGVQPQSQYSLPPLQMGASPVFISRAIVETLKLPLFVFNAGLPTPPAIPAIDLQGLPARCLSTGRAMDFATAQHLFRQGLGWGEKLATEASYLVLAECVVGGTTTALAVLTALGIAANGKVNSSHPTCNHDQKWQLVKQGMHHWQAAQNTIPTSDWPLAVVAAVGDPMQVVVAGMAIAASQRCGVLLAGGTQMLAVYKLAECLANSYHLAWNSTQIVVGTTRWVAEDATGDTVGLASLIGSVPLLATQLSFASSCFTQLQAYEQGFVKEGVGAGGCAIAASLYQNWGQAELLNAIEDQLNRYQQIKRKIDA